MNILRKTTIIVSILTLTAVLVPSFVFAGSTSVYFSDYLESKNNPEGHKSYVSKIFDLSYDADYEVKVYYRADSGSNEKYEEFNIYVDGSLIGKATDPNQGDDFENKSLGTHNFNSGRHTLKVEHAYSYSQVGNQSVFPLEVSFSKESQSQSSPTNNAPYADAGTNKQVNEGDQVTLHGSASDPDGDSLTYSWSCNGGYISNIYSLDPTFNAPQVSQDTTYICTLKVTDSQGSKDYDDVNILVKDESSPTNNAPYADAGSNKQVNEGNQVTLHGSASDPDGDSLTYSWSCNGGYISNIYSLDPTFNAPQVSQDTTYICTLKVTDSHGDKDSDTVSISVINTDYDQVDLPQVVTRSAYDIEEDGALLRGYLEDLGDDSSAEVWFEWGRTTSYGYDTSKMNRYDSGSFEWDLNGLNDDTTYHFRAIARNDAGIDRGEDMYFTTDSSWNDQNNRPTADAGSDKYIDEGDSVTLHGSASDPDGDYLTYFWSCDDGYLSNRYSLYPTFYAPDNVSRDIDISCSLEVTDEHGLSDSDYIDIEVRDRDEIESPEVNTLSPRNVDEDSAELRGDLKDLGDDSSAEVWFEWGRYSSLGNRTNKSTERDEGRFSRKIYNLDPGETYYYRAIARNDRGTDYGSVVKFETDETEEEWGNNAPTVSAGAHKDIYEGQSITLDGYAFDSDGYIASRNWSCTGGTLSRNDVDKPVFYAPQVSKNQYFTCVFSAADNDGLKRSDVTAVLVRNETGGYQEPIIIPSTSSGGDEDLIALDKLVRNVTKGSKEWSTDRIEAAPSDELEFMIRVASVSNDVVRDIVIRDNIQAGIIYKGDLTVDGRSDFRNLAESDIDIGDLSPDDTRTIIFSAELESEYFFERNDKNVSNTALAYNSEDSQTDMVVIEVGDRDSFFAALIGSITNIPFLDFLILLLIICVILVLVVWLMNKYWIKPERRKEEEEVKPTFS
jgi:hypothetical protein